MKLKPLWKEAFLTSALIAVTWESACYAEKPLIIDIERPSEFDEFNDPREMIVDIYYGDRYLMTQLITSTPEWVKLNNPKKIVDKIPAITTPDVILAALQKQLDPHNSLLCHGNSYEKCGYLLPEVAGIIFDQATLKIHLFINSDYLKFTPALSKLFLPPSDADKSFVQKIHGVMSGTRSGKVKSEVSNSSNDKSKKSSFSYTLGGHSLFALKESNIQLNYDYSDKNRLSLDSALFSRDFEGKQWQAGLLSTRGFGMAFSGDKAMLGVRLASSAHTRIDTELGKASVLQIFMPVRGTVDVFKDGKLMYTTFKEVGNHFIDTSNFEQGAYNVTIHIYDTGGNLVSEQTRFFFKDYSLPKKGVPDFFLEGGQVVNRNATSVLPKTTAALLARAGINYRISDSLAGSAVVATTQKRHFSELTLFNVGSNYRVSPGLLASADGSYGSKLMLNVYWKNVTAHFYRRFLRNKKDKKEIETEENKFRLLENSLAQSNLGIAFPLFKGLVSYNETHRRQKGSRDLKIKSLGYSRNLMKGDKYYLNGRFSYSQSSTGNKLYQLSLEFRLNDGGMVHGLTSVGNLQKYDRNDGDTSITRDNNFRYDWHWHNDERTGQDIDTHLSVQKNKQQTFLQAGSNLYSDYGHFFGSVAQSYNKNAGNALSYNANFNTHFATEGKHYSVGGYHYEDSGIIVHIEGTKAMDNFKVLVDGKKEGMAHGKWQSMIPLAPFSTYEVTIKPVNRGFYRFNESVRKVTLYPGNVVAMDYHIQSFRLIFGRLINVQGKSVVNAKMKDKTSFNSQTNEHGLFQLELPYDAKSFTFTKKDKSCTVLLPENSADKEIVNVGTIECQELS